MKRITAGDPQGYILGRTLWNAMYDGVLSLELPKGFEIVGFADDIVLTVIGETQEEVEMLATKAIGLVKDWMEGVKLKIAHYKLLLVSNCKAVIHGEITVGGHAIASQQKLKHLGVMLDDRLNFNSHVDYACEKTAKAKNVLTRLMLNIGDPRSSKRRLLAAVSTSLLRYGTPAWGMALQAKRNRDKLNSTFKLITMRVVSAYRTISSKAACVIAGMIPICFILSEDIKGMRNTE